MAHAQDEKLHWERLRAVQLSLGVCETSANEGEGASAKLGDELWWGRFILWVGRLEGRLRTGLPVGRSLLRLEREVSQALEVRRRRLLHGRGRLDFPAELPISSHAEEFSRALNSSQVVVVAGETGSGKSTQLPKLCLACGRGVAGQIAHTQPRRIAARSIARRIAEELGTEVGDAVGWQVRFDRATPETASIKVMTDGILLAETQADPDLLRYDTIIIDEAHERSLNIDFLLGYIKRLLTRREGLKLIITSATIDTNRFSAFFNDAPVIEVAGRSYPVSILSRDSAANPAADTENVSPDAIGDAVQELMASESGDILVFLPGEREIAETIKHLRGRFSDRFELLPLYARLPAPQQRKIFQPAMRPRIICATNVAETSLTVPGIHAVIDTGLVRISRYSARARLSRLPLEQVSQASAKQRAGRCGRLGPGRCIRLYSEAVFEASEPYTQPEILRSNLAGVILRMLALDLGDIDEFPFLERPPARMVAEAHETLFELEAINRAGQLTTIGKTLARMPCDPRLGRMLLRATEEHCAAEVIVIAAALSIRDPRLRPHGAESEADLAHAAWRTPKSDFIGLLRLWRDFETQRNDNGSAATRRWCHKRFLSWNAMREWVDTRRQLAHVLREVTPQGSQGLERLHIDLDAQGGWGAVHRSVLAGLVSNVGRRNEDGEYELASGARYSIHPGSGLRRTDAPLVFVTEIVETSKRYGRLAARIRGQWIERVAPHLLRREYSEPHFIADSGQVAAWERVFYGPLVIVPKRRVPFGPINATDARETFIDEALVGEKIRTRGEFLQRNRALRLSLEEQENRQRRHDLLRGDEARFNFYDAILPSDIHSSPSFERWRNVAEKTNPSLLHMEAHHVLQPQGRAADKNDFPDCGPSGFAFRYAHNPGEKADGITLEVPIAGLLGLSAHRLGWLVPGLLPKKIEALIRGLPKRVRTRLSPMREAAKSAAEELPFGHGDLKVVLAEYLSNVSGLPVAPADFAIDRLDDHLVMRILVRDEDGNTCASARSIEELQIRFATQAQVAFQQRVSQVASKFALSNDTILPVTALPKTVALAGPGGDVDAWLAVRDDTTSLGVSFHATINTARHEHRKGLIRALLLHGGGAITGLLDWLVDAGSQEVLWAASGARLSWRATLESLVVEATFLDVTSAWSVRSQDDLIRVYEQGFPGLQAHAEAVIATLETTVGERNVLRAALAASHPTAWQDATADIMRWVHAVAPPELAHFGWNRVQASPRRLRALARRFARLAEKGPHRDEADLASLAPWREGLRRLRERSANAEAVAAYEDALIEFGLHCFAPEFAAPGAASPKRLQAAFDAASH